MPQPVVNVTMPVFNRLELTQKSLLALRKCSQRIPFSITVVDNGSDEPLVKRLVALKEAGIIDKLFLLGRNIGIAGAANIGWEMTDAPFYMKLDNDIVIQDRDFFSKVFSLWSHGNPLSTLGGASRDVLLRHPGALETPAGTLGICANTLAGQAIFIPKQVSDLLGFWSEDYGLFGEDADYGVRMHCIGFTQYYYCKDRLWTDHGDDLAETYKSRDFHKDAIRKSVVTDEQGHYGLFMINQALYNLCIRTWKPVRRYAVTDVSSNHEVRLKENEEFIHYKALLDRCGREINMQVKTLGQANPDYIFTLEFINELKEIMQSGGFGCEGLMRQATMPGMEKGPA